MDVKIPILKGLWNSFNFPLFWPLFQPLIQLRHQGVLQNIFEWGFRSWHHLNPQLAKITILALILQLSHYQPIQGHSCDNWSNFTTINFTFQIEKWPFRADFFWINGLYPYVRSMRLSIHSSSGWNNENYSLQREK